MTTTVVVAIAVVLLCLALIARNLYRTSAWYRLHQARKGVSVHLPTDPACRLHTTPPRRGSRLWRAAAGQPCPLCDRDGEDGQW
ncbi:hypothetical protein KK103_09635 [Curtobacterium flaccumfaciens pv. flaccumfaciens]|uniref:Uncharacterized protein n=1 Tax=Curtobacterium flaccumfaciens pv. flaccumfaciens TaxID=138532 RepID=A0A9Q2W4Z5_9MICO|nr:hypothetical protein [Curtobacterium flaccumfaciens]MBT1542023.1 hypothetical protein [Curtobacterium flaccumfaciens pv. flaccumfaciens]